MTMKVIKTEMGKDKEMINALRKRTPIMTTMMIKAMLSARLSMKSLMDSLISSGEKTTS